MKFELKRYYRNISDSDLIQDVKNVAKQMEKDTVSIAEYNQYGKYHSTTILNRFSSWFNVLEKAGLQESCTKANVPDENYLIIFLMFGQDRKTTKIKRI